ncbi:hypothetical protein AB1Y20_015460 [Prymnesium parvum]|uniref:Uncharacterized protein n=1 Tax=Prymnesium parvum TaxID=97485 RepID=A0AB34K326_PRYPA
MSREKTTPAIARSVKVRRLLAKGKGAHGREQCACAQLQQAQCTCKLRGVERGGEDGGGQAGAAAFGARTGDNFQATPLPDNDSSAGVRLNNEAANVSQDEEWEEEALVLNIPQGQCTYANNIEDYSPALVGCPPLGFSFSDVGEALDYEEWHDSLYGERGYNNAEALSDSSDDDVNPVQENGLAQATPTFEGAHALGDEMVDLFTPGYEHAALSEILPDVNILDDDLLTSKF